MLNTDLYDPTILGAREKCNMSTQNLCLNIHSGIIHHSPKVEATQMLIDRWVDRSSVIDPYNRVLFSEEKG